MADERTLPIPSQHREFTVKVGGQEVPREHQLLSAGISIGCNKLGSARLAWLDGSAAAGGFALSEADLFKPGQVVEISAGPGTQAVTLFKGIVVRHALRVRAHSASQLVVECRHAAMKLAAVRRDRSWFDQSDSDIIEALVQGAGLQVDVAATSPQHKQIVQFHATDWDFLLARALANGLLVWPDGDTLVARQPSADGTASVTLQFGATMLEFDGEIDARRQYKAVRGVTWDPAQQEIVEADAQSPSFTGPGNLSGDDLADVAGADALELKHGSLAQAEAQAWADAAWLLARLDKVGGRAKCEGIGTIKPGDVVELAGVGARFNGPVFVTAVRHDFDTVQGWKTHVQFGGIETEPEPLRRELSAPAAGGLLARVAGLQVGVVTSNEDPDGEHRVRIRMPMVSKDDDGTWARVACPDAGDDRGFFFRPEVGDEVVAGFFDDDPSHPVILGMLHSSAKAAPLKGSDDNPQKVIKSRSGMRVFFDDENKILVLDTPAGNALTLSEQDKSLTLADQNGNQIVMDSDGIRIESKKALSLKAGTEHAMEAGTSLSIKAGTELKLESSTQAELAGGALTKVTGTTVMIN